MADSGLFVRTVLVSSFSLLFLFGTAEPSFATGNIVKSDLKGTWQITLRGGTATCGFATALATITFGTNGSGTGPLQLHGSCGDLTLAGQTLTVNSLSKTGEGTATLTCGPACDWHFVIQVDPDRATFHLVDLSDAGIFLEGLAVLSSPADHVAVADLKGTWQVTFFGQDLVDCGAGPVVRTYTAVGTLTLNTTGVGDLPASVHSSCGDFFDPVNPFTVGLNADGSGTATLLPCPTCASYSLNIQVSPDRSTFNFVTVGGANPNLFIAGVAVRRSTAGNITKTNLAGPWQVAIGAEDDGGCYTSLTFNFKLNAKAIASKVTLAGHSCDGPGVPPLVSTFTVLTLNADGSGTANFHCGVSCDIPFNIQISPDRSFMSLVSVEGLGDFWIGTGIPQ
jgi:hypothetical protein